MPGGTGAVSEPLACPTCGTTYPEQERFCSVCNLPLTYTPEASDEAPVSERHRRARKIKPQLAEGRLVRVAGGRNQAEAEFIQALLLEEGVPSLLRRSAGFDVPDFLAAGPRDVLVPEAGVTTAREILLEAELISATPPESARLAPMRLLAGLVTVFFVGALVMWLLLELIR